MPDVCTSDVGVSAPPTTDYGFLPRDDLNVSFCSNDRAPDFFYQAK
jgi:hypothetical protein